MNKNKNRRYGAVPPSFEANNCNSQALELDCSEQDINRIFGKYENHSIKYFAKVFSLKKNLLYKYLREIEFLNKCNVPTHYSVNEGYFKKYECNNDPETPWYSETSVPKITMKGVMYIVTLLKNDPDVRSKLQR